MTVEAFLERIFSEPLTPDIVLAGGSEAQWCFDLHRVRWNGSFLSLDGRTMVCTFTAPDMESARHALRAADADISRFWPGTLHRARDGLVANVIVERSFAEPVRYEDIAALGEAKPWCLETHNVRYSHTAFSLDRRRMLCFYAAPDAEAVRKVQRETEAPFDAVWAGTPFGPPQG